MTKASYKLNVAAITVGTIGIMVTLSVMAPEMWDVIQAVWKGIQVVRREFMAGDLKAIACVGMCTCALVTVMLAVAGCVFKETEDREAQAEITAKHEAKNQAEWAKFKARFPHRFKEDNDG